MSALEGVIPLFSGRIGRGLPKAGWTNQDLADLYRIEAALIQAGLPLDTARGESDEGDPWFVFCRPDTNDVLIHVARIDGEYVIASTGASFMLTGRSFTHIVKDFMAREPTFLLSNRRQNNVLMHPSSVLIAIFATLCIVNQDTDASIRVDSSDLAAKADAHGNPYELIPQLLNFALDSRGGSAGESSDTIFSSQNAFIILSSIAFASFTGAAHLLIVDLAAEDGIVPEQDGQEVLLASLDEHVDMPPVWQDGVSPQDSHASDEPVEENIVVLHPEMRLEDVVVLHEKGEATVTANVTAPTGANPIAPTAEIAAAMEATIVSTPSQMGAEIGAVASDEGTPEFYLPNLINMLPYVEIEQLSFDINEIPSFIAAPPVLLPDYPDMGDPIVDFAHQFEIFATTYTDAFYVMHENQYYVFQTDVMMDGDVSNDDAFIYVFDDGSQITFVGISQDEFFHIA